MLFHQQVLFTVVLSILGLAGMLTGTPSAAASTSAILLGLIIWGKVASDLYGLSGPDSALFLLQFLLVILLMEASDANLKLDEVFKCLKGRDDEVSAEARSRVRGWWRAQLLALSRLTAASFLLSLALLVFGSLVSVAVNQIAFSGALALVVVIALLILLTYRREPEPSRRLQP